MRRLTGVLAVVAIVIAANVAAQDAGTRRADTVSYASAWCVPGSTEPRSCYEDRSRCESMIDAERTLADIAAAMASSSPPPRASAAPPRAACEPLPRHWSCFTIREGIPEPISSTLRCFATAAARSAAQAQEHAPVPHRRDMTHQVTRCESR